MNQNNSREFNEYGEWDIEVDGVKYAGKRKLHQQLQKVREEERERIRQEVNDMVRAIKNDAHFMTELEVCEWLTNEVLSELDQPNK
jgi:hypothetical protein